MSLLWYKKVRGTNAYPDSNGLPVAVANGVSHNRTASVLVEAKHWCNGEGGMLSPDAVEVVVVSDGQEGDQQASECRSACTVTITRSYQYICL